MSAGSAANAMPHGPDHGGRHRRPRLPGAGAGAAVAREVLRGGLAGHPARPRGAHRSGGEHSDRMAVGRRLARQGRRSPCWPRRSVLPRRWCRRCASCGAASRVVVVGLGGFVTGPGGVAAWLTGRPAAHPRAECDRRIHQPLPVASGARGARSVSRTASDATSRRALIGNPVRAGHQRRAAARGAVCRPQRRRSASS